MRRGFTLIETIIYIALVAFIIGGAVAAAYNLIEGSGRLDTKAVIQEEGSFALRKIEWALSAASDFDTSVPQQLEIIRYDGIDIVIKRVGTSVSMSEDSGTNFLPLTNNRVAVTNLVFEDLPAVGPGPKGVRTTLTLNGTAFSTTHYLRK